MPEFVFEGATYSIDLDVVEWKKQKPIIQLPENKKGLVRYVEAAKWFPTIPPRPSVIEELIDLAEDEKCVQAILVNEAPEPLVITEPLTSKDIHGLIRYQRLRFLFRLSFFEFLDFTRAGFQGWIEMQYLHESVRGTFKDVKYRPKEIIGNDIVIEIDCDPRGLT